jgi:hypothetical protein
MRRTNSLGVFRVPDIVDLIEIITADDRAASTGKNDERGSTPETVEGAKDLSAVDR